MRRLHQTRINHSSQTFGLTLATVFITLSVLLFVRDAAAVEAEKTTANDDVPCATLENFAGDVQILDSSRTHLVVANSNVGIPCGGWVSTGTGWAQVRHRDGYQVNMSPHSYIGFPESNTDGHDSGDQVILYRGEVYASAIYGSGELRVLSANARARVKRGTMVVIFNEADRETQLISLDHAAELENRFEPTRRVQANGGEATSLNFRLVRVVPSAPRAVSIASIRPILAQMHVGEHDRSFALKTVKRRVDRKFAADLETEESDSDTGGAKLAAKRTPAGLEFENREAVDNGEPPKPPLSEEARKLAAAKLKEEARKRALAKYIRNTPDEHDAELRDHWVKRMVAGESSGAQMLYPGKSKTDGNDPGVRFRKKAKKGEEDEKKKLIDELSQIRED